MQKVIHSPERLIGIYNQYKRLSARLVSEIVLVGIDKTEEAKRLHKALISAFENFDICDLSYEQAERLDMKRFDDYQEATDWGNDFLVLFPLWMLPIIPDNIAVKNIFGTRINRDVTHKISPDTRSGLLAYGIMNSQFRYKKVLLEKYKVNLKD